MSKMKAKGVVPHHKHRVAFRDDIVSVRQFAEEHDADLLEQEKTRINIEKDQKQLANSAKRTEQALQRMLGRRRRKTRPVILSDGSVAYAVSYSSKTLAELLGVSQPTIGNWEKAGILQEPFKIKERGRDIRYYPRALCFGILDAFRQNNLSSEGPIFKQMVYAVYGAIKQNPNLSGKFQLEGIYEGQSFTFMIHFGYKDEMRFGLKGYQRRKK